MSSMDIIGGPIVVTGSKAIKLVSMGDGLVTGQLGKNLHMSLISFFGHPSLGSFSWMDIVHWLHALLHAFV